jgi:hypothetical protein
MILKNLLGRKTRSLLTIVGIGIGIAAMVALGAIADGLEEGYTAMLTGSQGDLAVTQADAADISAAAVDETVGQQLETLPEVEDVTGMLQSIVTAEGARYFMIFGYDPQGFAIEHFKIVEGRFSHRGHLRNGRRSGRRGRCDVPERCPGPAQQTPPGRPLHAQAQTRSRRRGVAAQDRTAHPRRDNLPVGPSRQHPGDHPDSARLHRHPHRRSGDDEHRADVGL